MLIILFLKDFVFNYCNKLQNINTIIKIANRFIKN